MLEHGWDPWGFRRNSVCGHTQRMDSLKRQEAGDLSVSYIPATWWEGSSCVELSAMEGINLGNMEGVACSDPK